MDLLTAPADTAEAVAALIREVTPSDVTHIHVTGMACTPLEDEVRTVSGYNYMEPVYEAGRAALGDADYSYWSPTEHYGYGINWQWIHLCDGRRIALTWLG